MRQEDDLLRHFADLARRQGIIQLLNAYRGIPVIHPAEVRSIRKDYVVVETHPHQLVCMQSERSTHLVFEGMAYFLQARVAMLDFLPGEAVLANFRRSESAFSKRITLRVQPEAPVEFRIYDGVTQVAAVLVDISASGMAFTRAGTLHNGAGTWVVGQSVYVDIMLPQAEERLHFKGRITHLAQEKGVPLLRVGLAIDPDPPEREALQKYIAVRQAETLVELDRVYESLCRQKGTGF